MAFMRMMQMSIVQVVDMVIVHDAGMPAFRAMRMIMIIVLQVALAHCQVLIKCYLVKYTDRLLIHALSIMIKSSASALHSRHRHRGTPATTVAAGCECPPVGCNKPLGPAWRLATLRLALAFSGCWSLSLNSTDSVAYSSRTAARISTAKRLVCSAWAQVALRLLYGENQRETRDQPL